MKKLINKVGIFIIGSALVSTLIPFSSAVSSPVKDAQISIANKSLKDSQKRLTKSSKPQATTQPIPAIKQRGMLISQNLDTSLAGRWTAVLTPISDSCGAYLLSQLPVDITVRTSGNTVEILEGQRVYQGELTNNGRDAKARGRVGYGVYTWLLMNRIGNTATLVLGYQSDYGCSWIYYGEAKFQSS
ncbi:hypothetical protein SD81_036270 [Tolypothrix campylonemoides VB511288]|nr:hypothetical protein SD81_036270 [Tolypothrix campylonemoides VB511288]